MAQRVDAYMICTTPRSGSTLLCRMLAATGIAGQPDSHFHTPSLERWLTVFDIPSDRRETEQDARAAVFAAARRRGSGGAGPFGLRMQRGSFAFFIEQAGRLAPSAPNDLARIEAAFGHTAFVHLTRADKLGQAISRCIAEQSGLWHRNADGTELERSASPAEPVYDADAIARHIGELTSLDREWEEWFAAQRIEPLRLTYETLSARPQACLARVLSALGLDPSPASGVHPPVARLANATNAAWAARYRAERAAG
ncbi:MAG: Stf0 family sulfotransferase [Pseudomonadota bacterium]